MQKLKTIFKRHALPLSASLLISAFLIKTPSIATLISNTTPTPTPLPVTDPTISTEVLQNQVLPNEGVILPINWADFGARMLKDGVIDEEKFRKLYPGGISKTDEVILSGTQNQPITLNLSNNRLLLNIFWAFGLANQNEVLTSGEIADERIGSAANYASTGGWSLAKGDVMNHFNRHQYVTLTKEQQAVVEEVSKNIYRPCCNNSTHFPDCNHGMAMLGLLELMAKAEVPASEMYKIALKVNSFWFPQTYIDLAAYFREQGLSWENLDAKVALSKEYSSATGYQQTRLKIQNLPEPLRSGGGCGV